MEEKEEKGEVEWSGSGFFWAQEEATNKKHKNWKEEKEEEEEEEEEECVV